MIRLKRIYDPPERSDGYRVLVDRLWPRGVSRERAQLDAWLKAVAPTPDLRTWFGHEPARFDEFRDRYRRELGGNPATLELARWSRGNETLTLLFAAKDTQHNHAVVLREYLAGK